MKYFGCVRSGRFLFLPWRCPDWDCGTTSRACPRCSVSRYRSSCQWQSCLFWQRGFHRFGWRDIPSHPAIWVPFGAVWVVWMLNLYNFMDGIDGLAGGEAAVTASFFFLVFAHYGESGWAVANLFIAAASMGFLVHNWPPATVFMGDAGSVFLGGFFGMQTVAASLTTPIPFVVLVLPFSNFILDTTATLIRRIWRGEKWYTAHRSHYYQRMTNLGWSHARVTGMELVSAALSCLAAILYLRSGAQVRVLVVSAVLIGFLALGIWVSRKDPLSAEKKNNAV